MPNTITILLYRPEQSDSDGLWYPIRPAGAMQKHRVVCPISNEEDCQMLCDILNDELRTTAERIKRELFHGNLLPDAEFSL